MKLSIPTNYRGVVLTCLAFGIPTLNWFKITERGREQVISNVRNEEGIVSSQLFFLTGFQSFHAGQYVCSDDVPIFTIELGESLAIPSCLVDSTMILFQIRVLNTQCKEWDESLKQVIKSQFLQSLIAILSVRCSECSINANDLMLTEGLICSSQVDRAALLRGIISIAFCELNIWQQSGPFIAIDGSLHQVDRHCNLRVTSLSAGECPAHSESAMAVSIAVVSSASAAFGFIVAATAVCCIVLVLVIRQR